MIVRAAILSLTLLAATPVIAARPVAQPVGKWAAEGENGRCMLSRDFADGRLSIEVLPQNDSVHLMWKAVELVGPLAWVGGKVTFGDGGRAAIAGVSRANLPDKLHSIRRINVDRTDIDRAAASGVIEFSVAGWNASLAVPALHAGLAVLDHCAQNLADHVGMAPEAVALIAHPAAPVSTLFRLAPDYFKDAANEDPEDEAIARYLVDAQGAVINCGLVRKAVSDRLNSAACKFASAGGPPFTPAKDKDGHAVPGLYFVRGTW